MPRTVESIVACHQEARARRRAGRPIWDASVPIKSLLQDCAGAGDDISASQAAELCHRMHALLRARLPPTWLDVNDPNFSFSLDELMDELRDASTDGFSNAEWGTPVEQINGLLDQLYDWADRHRVWIG